MNQGVPDEACAPYTMGATGKDVACNTVCGDKASRTQKALSAKNLLNPEEVKAGLARGPVMASMYVYEDFTAYSSGIYKHTMGQGLGGHAISIIGFDDTKRAWIIRNSWGPDWGIKGFGYVSYDDVSGIGSKGIQFEVVKEDDYLWTDLKDRSFVSGQKELIVKSNSKSNQAWTVAVTNKREARVADTTCVEATCSLSLNTSELPDGEYELTARQGSSELHRYFYISNEAGDYKIKMTPLFDAKAAVKGRIEFDLKLTQDSKVPLTRIAFVYENSNGVVKERWTESVANEMTQGWRTNTVSNGRYKVWYRGEQVVGGRALTFDSSKLALDIKN
ncbi:Papain family cysteine protease [compost metagenome]